jgi:16S rRNA (guanine527-N7)-methyltransferase
MDALSLAVFEMLGTRLSDGQLRAFESYADELAAWNQRVNLTAITEPGAVEMRHFLDPLSCLLVLPPVPGLRVIDVGTGAGFPGLPIKIMYPELHLTLLEATGKKVAFLEHLVEQLGLEGVALVNARAEEVGQQTEHREAYEA